MIGIVLVFLILLWFLGYITIPGLVIPSFPLFYFSGHPITLWDVLVFLLILAVIGFLPRVIKVFAVIVLIVWALSTFRIFYFTGLPHILLLVIIIGLVISLVG